MLQAEQTLQEATNDHYDIGVTTGGMSSSVRQSFALHFVQKLVEALSGGEHVDQIQLKVIEGVQQKHPRPLALGFNCQTEVNTLGKGAGGRYVFFGTPAQVAKKGPVSQQLTSVVSTPNMFGPVILNCRVRWNQFYKTVRHGAPPQHMISAVQQTQTASNNFVWLYTPLATDSNTSRDSQICIRDLHHSLNGVKPIESLHTDLSCIAIKKNKQLTQQELSQIDFRLQLSPSATVEVACQVDHSIILHQLTVDRLDSTAHDAQKLSVAELQQILMQAAEPQHAALQHQSHPQAASSFPDMHAGTSQSYHRQHNILSSRVIGDIHGPAHASASASNRDKTSQGPINFSSLKALVDKNLQWVKTKLDDVYDHLMAHGETLDDITDYIHSVPATAAQQAPQQRCSKPQQGNPTPASLQGMPSASCASVAMANHPPPTPYHAEMDESVQHVLQILEHPHSPEVVTVVSEDDCDNMQAEAPEPAVSASPVAPPPPSPGAAQPRDPFFAISATNLRQAILTEMHGMPPLFAEDISCRIWPLPEGAPDISRKFMRSKVNNMLYAMEHAKDVECCKEADSCWPKWSF